MSELQLPKQVIKAARKSPKNMIMYGPPKVGKTTALSQLDGCLILTSRTGQTWWTHSRSKQIPADLAKIGKAIISEGKPYKYIAIDTITQLEVWCEEEGKKMYQQTAGKNFDKDNKGLSVLSLPTVLGICTCVRLS